MDSSCNSKNKIPATICLYKVALAGKVSNVLNKVHLPDHMSLTTF